MKICILNSVHPLNDTRVKRVAETLAEGGHEISIIAPASRNQALGLFEEWPQITTLALERRSKGSFQKGRGAPKIFRTILSRIAVSFELFNRGLEVRADVYHCNEVDSWVVGVLLSIFSKSRVVFDVHEYYPARVTDVLSGRIIGPIAEGLARFFFNVLALFTDGLIFVNQSLVDLYKSPGKITVLRNCVRKSDFNDLSATDELKRRYQGRVVVLHIGSLREQYGPGALLNSLAYIQNPQVLFLIIGGAGEGFLSEIEERGHSEQIQVIDQVPFGELLAYLALADIGISPLQPTDKNTEYSLARKFLEYIAAGLPVVVSDFPEYRTIVEQYGLGLLVDPAQPEQIASAVDKLAGDEGYRHQLSENAARAFELELNWEMESRKLFELYEQLSTE
jgi:glycosyltransferase involved in cell wall biosynthesis